MPAVTDAEHRALDERLDIITWGCALLVVAIMFLLPGAGRLWHFLMPFGLVFITMSVVRQKIKTRRDTTGLIVGIAFTGTGLLDLVGIDLQFFPLVPAILAIVGSGLIFNAVVSKRLRVDPDRPPE